MVNPCHVLFICTHSSARSIMPEAVMNQLGAGRFAAHSAGSHPRGEVHPLALEVLQVNGFAISGLHSKSWDAFAAPDAPKMDFVFTLCDRAAGEACPHWPDQPVTAHWGYPDPSVAGGDLAAQRTALPRTLLAIMDQLRLFMSLPFHKLDRMSLRARVRELGQR